VTSDLTPRPTIGDVYDQGAASYAEHWAPALNRHARDLAGTVPPPQDGWGRIVLDVAAGAGTLLPALRAVAGKPDDGGLLVALDYSAGMLALADPAVPRIRADAAALPLHEGCADVAVYSFVLFLLPDARTAIAEAARVLRPGGWLLAAPNRRASNSALIGSSHCGPPGGTEPSLCDSRLPPHTSLIEHPDAVTPPSCLVFTLDASLPIVRGEQSIAIGRWPSPQGASRPDFW
jgi:SAM-dependent methyltransferase